MTPFGRPFAILLGTLVAVALCAGAAPAPAWAKDPVEVTYATFLDPSNASDPRVGAQARMIEAFEKANPDIKVRIVLDPVGNVSSRALKAGADSPAVTRLTSYSLPELVRTGNLRQLDGLVADAGIANDDWLIPLDRGRIGGHLWGLPQDFRIPVLMYRRAALAAAGVTPPSTWEQVCADGGKPAHGPTVGYAVPLGASGGAGGAQALGEYVLSTMLAPDGQYFASDNRAISFSKETFVRAAQTIKDLYGRCRATPLTSAQFGYNEIHDGLRAGTVAMATFGLARFGAIRRQGAGDDLGWAPPPAYTPDGKQTVFGFVLAINSKSPHPEENWKLVQFATSKEGQAILAEGGEVVARTSSYQAPYFQTPDSANQKAWAELVRTRGQLVSYSVILTTFHEIVGEALQRMVLRNGTPEAAYDETVKRYGDAVAKLRDPTTP